MQRMKTRTRTKPRGSPTVASVLQKHFRSKALHHVITTSRVFPLTARADLQTALDEVLQKRSSATKQFGVHQTYAHDTLTFATLASMDRHAPRIGPLQHEELEIGAELPIRCLTTSLWLGEHAGERFALLLSPSTAYGRNSGLHIEIARMPGRKADLSRMLIDEIEKIIALAQSYRGKVISLEKLDNYSGKSGGIKVHKLRAVSRSKSSCRSERCACSNAMSPTSSGTGSNSANSTWA